MSVIYKLLIEAESGMPYFQVIALVVHEKDDLLPERLHDRLQTWLGEQDATLLAIDPEETAPIEDAHVPEDIRLHKAEMSAVSGRIFHPGTCSLWKRMRSWLF